MDLQLRERTVLIAGPFSTHIQGLIHNLTQLGADVVLLNQNPSVSQRFCTQISDAREINPKFGRAASVQGDFSSAEKVKSSLSDAARVFGSLDIYIDAFLWNEPSPFVIGEDFADLGKMIQETLQNSLVVTNHILSYLKGRKRGRVVYLMNEPQMKNHLFSQTELYSMAVRSGLLNFAKGLSKQVSEFNITVNVLSLGVTEEWILSHHSGKTIKEALELMKQKDSSLKITEPDKVAQGMAFLVSSLGVSVNGQTIELT